MRGTSSFLVLGFCVSIFCACSTEAEPAEPDTSDETSGQVASAASTSCTNQIYGSGLTCGNGYGGCTAGAIYSCTSGAATCTLTTVCPNGCERPTTSHFGARCFGGAAPFALSSSTVAGGGAVTATATLSVPHFDYFGPGSTQVSLQGGLSGGWPIPASSTARSQTVAIGTATTTSSKDVFGIIRYFPTTSGSEWFLFTPPRTLTITPGTAPVQFSTSGALQLSPNVVVGGQPSVGTIRLDGPAAAGGFPVTLVADTEPNNPNDFVWGDPSAITLPASVDVPAGATTVTFPVITKPVPVGDPSRPGMRIHVRAFDSRGVGSHYAYIGLQPSTTSCTPTTCATAGKNCGSISDGCGGTLTCGACTYPQTCGGGGIANVCGGGTTSACKPRGATCATSSECCNGRRCRAKNGSQVCD